MFWNKKEKSNEKSRSTIKHFLDSRSDPKTICAYYLKIFREGYKIDLTIRDIEYSDEPFMIFFYFNEKILVDSSEFRLFKDNIEVELDRDIPGYKHFLARTSDSGCDMFVINVFIDLDKMGRDLEEIQDYYSKASSSEKKCLENIIKDMRKNGSNI